MSSSSAASVPCSPLATTPAFDAGSSSWSTASSSTETWKRSIGGSEFCVSPAPPSGSLSPWREKLRLTASGLYWKTMMLFGIGTGPSNATSAPFSSFGAPGNSLGTRRPPHSIGFRPPSTIRKASFVRSTSNHAMGEPNA